MLRYFNGYAAVLGVIGPIVLMLVDRFSSQGWWPSWIIAIWPTSYMLIGTAGTRDFAAWLLIAFSVGLNGVLYGLIGAVLKKAWLA